MRRHCFRKVGIRKESASDEEREIGFTVDNERTALRMAADIRGLGVIHPARKLRRTRDRTNGRAREALLLRTQPVSALYCDTPGQEISREAARGA